jgi:hypothetical protein
MNNTNNININKNNEPSHMFDLKKSYGDLSYFDTYGGSLFTFIIVSIIFLLLVTYCYLKINIVTVKNDWANKRCNPFVIPIAGYINKPDNMNANDYTKQNFEYCTQNMLIDTTGRAVQPITFITNSLTNVSNSLSSSLNDSRGMFNKLRNNLKDVSTDVMQRVVNVTVPLQEMFLSIQDFIAKIQGALTATLFTFLGSYYAMQSFMNYTAKMIVQVLVAMVGAIVVLWAVPFTWGAAAGMSAAFLAISVPMAVILGFMVDVMKVNPGVRLPKLKCFDKNTMIEMNNGSFKSIEKICVGDKLKNNNRVTAKIKIDTFGSSMYCLNDVIVSDSHLVRIPWLNGYKWIRVCEHPDAIKVKTYNEPYLYCLNTKQKEIEINKCVFSDWDEIDDEKFSIRILQNPKYNKEVLFKKDIHKYFDGGFSSDTIIQLEKGLCKSINKINIGDVLKNGEKVYGLVEIDGTNLTQYYYNLGENLNFKGGPNLTMCDKIIMFRNTMDLDDKYKRGLFIKQNRLYHLLTDSGSFAVCQINFGDYNTCIDSIF